MLARLSKNTKRMVVVLCLVMAGVIGVSAGAAYAVVTTATSGVDEKAYMARDDAAFNVTSAGVWQNIPSMVRTVTVPAGTTRQFIARYTAESLCGGNTGWCSVRVVIIDAAGALIEFYPQSGTDFAFDSPNDSWESHAVDRSSNYMAAGDYRVQVQGQLVAGAASFRLDDMHLTIEQRR